MVLSWTDLVMQSRTLVVCQDKASRIGRKPSRMANLIERPQRRTVAATVVKTRNRFAFQSASEWIATGVAAGEPGDPPHSLSRSTLLTRSSQEWTGNFTGDPLGVPARCSVQMGQWAEVGED